MHQGKWAWFKREVDSHKYQKNVTGHWRSNGLVIVAQMKGHWLRILLPFILWWAFPLSLCNLPAWQLALRGSLPVASCIPSEKPSSLVLKEHSSRLVQYRGRGRRGKGEKQWWCFLFPFGIRMRRRNPCLTLTGDKKHLPVFPGNFTPFEGHLGKDKNCWCGKLEIPSVTFSLVSWFHYYTRGHYSAASSCAGV